MTLANARMSDYLLHVPPSQGWSVPALALLAALIIVPVPGSVAAVQTAAAPTVQPPAIELLDGGALSSVAIPLLLSWPAGLPGGAPIARYRLKMSIDGGSWSRVRLTSPLELSARVKARPSEQIRFRLRAIDVAGQRSAWAETAPVVLSATRDGEPAIGLSAGWWSAADTHAFGGRRATTTLPAQTAGFTFVGRQIGWVAQRGPSRGAADVYLDGTWTATVDLYGTTNAARRMVFRATWPSVGGHTLAITTAGTPGRPRVDLDTLVVLAEPGVEPAPATPTPWRPTPKPGHWSAPSTASSSPPATTSTTAAPRLSSPTVTNQPGARSGHAPGRCRAITTT